VYDSGPNAATERDSEVVRELLEPLPRGRALDAACGTGRQSALLAELGYEVEGVDLNETMLGFARARVPGAHFMQGRLEAIPHDDASFDVAVCSLALTHIPELLPGLAELARVVRPGGYGVISDIHPMAVHLGISAGFTAPDITEGMIQVPNLLHEVSEYVGGFLATGWEICGCVESEMPESAISGHPAYAVVPDSVRGAFEGIPLLLAWTLRRRSN
jgi:SAM-dependent methyltransferase